MPLNEFIHVVCQHNEHSPTLDYIQKRSVVDEEVSVESALQDLNLMNYSDEEPSFVDQK